MIDYINAIDLHTYCCKMDNNEIFSQKQAILCKEYKVTLC